MDFEQGLLAECLGVGVHVWPAKARCTTAAGFHHLVVDPCFSTLFALGAEERDTRRAELLSSFLAEPLQHVRSSACCVEVGSGTPCCLNFGSPIDRDVERRLRKKLFVGLAAPVSCDVAGGHADEVRLDVGRLQDGEYPVRSEQIDLDRRVERVVERNGGRAVNHDVGAAESSRVGFVETKAIDGHVAGDDAQLAACTVAELVAPLLAQSVEGVVAQNLAFDPPVDIASPRLPHEEDQVAIVDGAQQTLDERCTEEPCAPGDGYPFPGECLCDHRQQFYHHPYHLVRSIRIR